LVNLANSAGVVIYVIDTVGIYDPCPNSPAPHVIPSAASYRKLAKDTGGLFILSAPGRSLSEDLGKVLEDMSGYYLIGYQPQSSDFDLVHGQPVHHDIQVKVRRAGLTVRARNGFLGVPDSAESAKPQPQSTAEFLQEALESPFTAGAIRLRLDPIYGASAPDPKTKRRQAELRTLLEVEVGDLKFTGGVEGKKKLTYTALVAVFRQNGTPVSSAAHTYTITATPEEEARLAASGLHMMMDIPLPAPGAYQVRAAIRDETSGELGSAYSFLDVPDFNKPQLVLSSIELTSSPSSPGTGLSSRVSYAAGAAVDFECEVFGVRNASKPPREPHVEMEVRLFRDGASEPAYDSKAIPVSVKTLAENFLAGQIRIGQNIEPGDYTMQLTVFDRLAPEKKQAAVQWTNLRVVKPAMP
jgi:hypothetical protein